MKEIQVKTKTENVKQIAEEISLTAIALGFILSGLLGGADLTRHIQLPISWERIIGGVLMGYVLVGTGMAVHFGIKYITRKK